MQPVIFELSTLSTFAHFLSRFHQEQWLIIFHRAGIFYQYFYYSSFYFTFNFIEQLHGFDDANYFAGGNFIAYFINIGLSGPDWR